MKTFLYAMHIECNAQFLVVPSTDMQLCSIKTKSLKQSRGLKLQNILVEVVKVWYIYVLIHTKTKKVFLRNSQMYVTTGHFWAEHNAKSHQGTWYCPLMRG